jgi:Spy/CpxP family protein refolding chaperone
MTRFVKAGSAVLIGTLVAGSVAFAQRSEPRGERPGIERGPGGAGRAVGLRGVRDLNLSDAQRQQIRAITSKAREDNRPIAERLRQAVDARRKAMAITPVDENQIRSTTQALATAQADMAVARAKMRSDIVALLTPEQQARVNAARESTPRRDGRPGRRGRG